MAFKGHSYTKIHPDLLTTITNGLGDTTTISYKPLTDETVYTPDTDAEYPFRDIHKQGPMYVVDSYSTSDGIGGTYSFSYKYGGAKAHLIGRGFLGFRWMETTDTTTGITTRAEYNQTFPTNGLADKIEVRLSDNTLIEQTTNTWQSSSDSDPDGNLDTSEALYTISLKDTTKRTYELDGSQISRVYTDNQNDTYGNVTNINVMTFRQEGVWVSSKTTTNTYTNDTTNWYLGRLTRAVVSSFIPNGVFATRTSAFEYDPVTGLLTKEIIEPDQANFKLITEYGYDSYGHKTSVTVSCDAGATDPIVSRTTTTSYNYTNLSVDGIYTTTTTNALSHSETKTIDARFGVVTSLIGPNLLATSWEYDSLGRKAREDRADGTYTTISYDHCDAITCATAPTTAALKITSQVASTTVGITPLPASTTYFDKLGREVRSEGVGFNGTLVYKDTQYNNRGKVDKVTTPYFVGGTIYLISYQYDVLGRAITETRPDGSVVTRTYTMIAEGHETVERIQHTGDGIDQSTTQLNNSLGQLIKVTDNATGTLQYTYDAFGNLLTTIDPVGNTVSMTYDIRGRKTAMDDPDMGHWEYKHNVLGELVWQKDANLNEVTMSYDVLGRMVSRTEPEGTSTWEYDTGNKAIGKLNKATGSDGYLRTYFYDTKGRTWGHNTLIGGVSYLNTNDYDAYSRVSQTVYPNGFATKNSYNAQGFLSEVQNASTSQPYWQANEANALGQTTLETFGNNVQTVRLYDDVTGRMTGISSGIGASSAVQSLAYAYDALGNLKTRQDTNRTLTEDFSYDNLNRLTGTTLNGIAGTTYQYDSIGNITHKSDVGSYLYGNGNATGAGDAGPHAVTSAGSNTYAYDDNGNQTGGDGRAIVYSSYNKPTSISKGGNFRLFSYAPDRSRYNQYHWDGTKGTTTIYLGALYEKIDKTNSAVTEHKYYLYAGGKRVAIYTSKSDASPSTTRYIHTDHLGSIDTITKEDGSVEESLSYDAFGKRRVAGDWSVLSSLLAVMNTNRGFTGHEHLDDVGLIHMNGRVYDPTLGRFLSADPFVQFPKNTQSLNRYSYVLNNPLSYTDPSGFGLFSKLWKKVKRAWKKVFKSKVFQAVVRVVAYVVGFVTGQYWIPALVDTAFAKLNGASWGQALKAGATTYASMYAFGEIGGQGWGTAGEMAASGVVGGTQSEIMGGKFSDGFYSMAFSRFARPWVGGNMIKAMVAGGASAVLGGGKFKNGAVTTSFSYLVASAYTSKSASLSADGKDATKGSGWFRQKDHDYVIGRPGSIVPPRSGLGKFIDDYLPAGHTFGANHDSLVGYLVDRLGVPDLIANVPTMPATYLYSVGQELINTPVRSTNYIFRTDFNPPFEHSDPR